MQNMLPVSKIFSVLIYLLILLIFIHKFLDFNNQISWLEIHPYKVANGFRMVILSLNAFRQMDLSLEQILEKNETVEEYWRSLIVMVRNALLFAVITVKTYLPFVKFPFCSTLLCFELGKKESVHWPYSKARIIPRKAVYQCIITGPKLTSSMYEIG